MEASNDAARRTGSARPLAIVAALLAVAVAAVVVYRLAPRPAPDVDLTAAPVAALPAVAADPSDHGKRLYERSCAACHGERGDGNGPAARFLYPKPRNFGEVKFRVVSTANLMPADADLRQVIDHGMPGSAMFPFAHLGETDRQALVGYVRQLVRAAVIERQRADAGGNVDLAELGNEVDQYLKPGEPLTVPADLPAASPESVARGLQLYRSEGCSACHGPTGKGDGPQDQRDSAGVPIRPRDFGRGIFKGGHTPQQLYTRIVLGMPGTPMPASPKLKPADVGDLVSFILSLADDAARERAAHQRTTLAAARSPHELPEVISDADWQAARPVRITVSPLWWRDFAEPDLHVAALTDGKTLALRLTWRDATRNDSAARPEDFVDMAAVQLFKGGAEPFLGMGASTEPIDLWQWRAGRKAEAVAGGLDDYPFDAPLYQKLTGSKVAPDFLTARAAGNQIVSPGAGSLTAKGFGSTTFRPKASQVVTASAAWQDGRWTIALRRPLQVGADDGLSFAVGEACSVAFALWDGAARDRNGQKLVSIWHDLKIE